MKTIILAAAALIGSVNIGLATTGTEKCTDMAAFLKTFPDQRKGSPCVYGAAPSLQCQVYIDNWMAAMAKEKHRCEKRAGNL